MHFFHDLELLLRTGTADKTDCGDRENKPHQAFPSQSDREPICYFCIEIEVLYRSLFFRNSWLDVVRIDEPVAYDGKCEGCVSVGTRSETRYESFLGWKIAPACSHRNDVRNASSNALAEAEEKHEQARIFHKCGREEASESEDGPKCSSPEI